MPWLFRTIQGTGFSLALHRVLIRIPGGSREQQSSTRVPAALQADTRRNRRLQKTGEKQNKTKHKTKQKKTVNKASFLWNYINKIKGDVFLETGCEAFRNQSPNWLMSVFFCTRPTYKDWEQLCFSETKILTTMTAITTRVKQAAWWKKKETT